MKANILKDVNIYGVDVFLIKKITDNTGLWIVCLGERTDTVYLFFLYMADYEVRNLNPCKGSYLLPR